MYINTVRASAFGPLRGRTLDLAPGLNVVHGPNETGKSSWFAATYAGLAGRRKARGRGTTAQAEFAKRHKPWSGTQWSAGVTVTLDNGLVLAIEQNLSKGEWTLLDGTSRQPISLASLERRLGMELTTEGTLDGTRLLGLNRESARATVFTGQADILKVLDHAEELQEYLERAATTEAADMTAEGALTWLAARRSDWVGAPNIGAKPLRSRRLALDNARRVTTQHRDALARLVEAIGQRQRITIELARARDNLDQADRLQRWQDVYELRGRLRSAEDLSTQLADLTNTDLTVDEDKVRAAGAILGAFDTGSDVPPLPAGPSAVDLQAEIDALPQRPEGDLEPRPRVEAAHRELSRAQTALTTQAHNAPPESPQSARFRLTPDELRTMADTLEAVPPVLDPDLMAEQAFLQNKAHEEALAYATAKAAAERRNDETACSHAAAVEEHTRTLAEFARVRADRTAARDSLRQRADDAAVAYTIAQAAHDAANQRNEEKLNAHAAAVQKHAQAFAEYERAHAERSTEFESRRRAQTAAATEYANAKAAYDMAARRNEEKRKVHTAATAAHATALADHERRQAERNAEYEVLRQETADAAAKYAEAQAAWNAATHRNTEKLHVHTAAMQEHARAAAAYARSQADLAARRELAPSSQFPRAAKKMVLMSAGAVVLVVGIVLTTIGLVVPGILVALVGAALAIAAVVVARAPMTAQAPAADIAVLGDPLEPPAPPELEDVNAAAAPTPNPRLAVLEVELRAQPPAAPDPPHLEELTAPTAPQPDPRLVEIEIELRTQPPAAPDPPRLEELTALTAPEPDPRLAELKAQLAVEPPTAPASPQVEDVHAIVAPQPAPRLTSVEVDLKAQENAARQHGAQVANARARVLAESLDPDPATLRQLARAIDDAEAARQRARAHAEQAAALRSTRDDAVRSLATTLGLNVAAEITDDTVDEQLQAFEAYVSACRNRATVATLASRRPDLVAAHDQRRQLEITHAAAVAERDAQIRALQDFAIGFGVVAGAAHSETADQIRVWVRAQEQQRETLARKRELVARLDQVTGGRNLTELQAELTKLMDSAGPEPDTAPADVEQFRAEVVQRHDMVLERAGQLTGQQQQLSQALGSVAEAVELEAEAERAVAQVELLASCVDSATAELNLAKDRAHASIAPALEARMRPWFPRVTNGRYLDVAVAPKDLTMKVTDASGAVRQAELLSHGTTEQLFLLLRVTLSQVLSGDRETAPLILDDVTVQSDHARTIAILDLLHEISADHQVLLFAQEQAVVTWAEANLDPRCDKLIALPAPT